jgi:hypothetical protein
MEDVLNITRAIAFTLCIIGCIELSVVLILDTKKNRRKTNGKMD